MNCPICAGGMERLIELPRFPITEMYEPFTSTFLDRGYIDQAFMYCEPCGHGKLRNVISPATLYGSSYRTVTGKSVGALGAVLNFRQFIGKHIKDTEYDCVVDIGGNDGTLLEMFRGKRRVAVDPNAVDGTELVREFIENADLAHLKPAKKLICSSHTLEHIEDPHVVFSKLRDIVTDTDYCAFQFPSLKYLVEDYRFDQSHHQHVHYYSLRSISKLLHQYGFEITHAEYDASHYGALMVIFRKGDVELGAETISAHRIYDANIVFHNEMECLNDRMNDVKGVVGYGAALMLPVLKYYIPRVADIEYLVDEDESKHGLRYTNLNLEIKPMRNLTGDTVMVTAFSTKMALRQIVGKLFRLQVKNIIVPFHYL